MVISIREYREKDKSLVIAFVNRLRNEIYGSSSPNSSDLADISKNYHIFLLTEESDKIIGTCGLLKSKSGGQIKRIYVEKEHRSKGIGAQMISNVISFAKDNKIPKIELFTYESNIAAASFFEKVGFARSKTENGKIYFEKTFSE